MASNQLQDGQVQEAFRNDQAKGVPVHTFDPDATPQEKAAAAGKARDQLKDVRSKQPDPVKDLAVDTGNSNVIPTITVHGVEAHPDDVAAAVQSAKIPGSIDAGPYVIPDWYKVGWRAVGGIDSPELQGEVKDTAVLAAFLKEQYYGDWYHNAGLVFFVAFVTRFMTLFRFGWGWLIILLAGCATYYSTSIARVRRRARDDIQRELLQSRLPSEHESAEWLNHFLQRFWIIYEPVLSATVVSTVDQLLSANCPPFLDSLRLTEFTLGNKAFRIDQVRTFPKTEEDIVMMDWAVSFTPNDVSDMTPREVAKKVNPKIVLSVRVGRGIAAAGMPILLEDLSFSGQMRVRMKLMTNFPHVQLVGIMFLEPPMFDYVLKPIGGEHFGFDIGNVPGLSAFIRNMVHSTLGPMMYDPHVFTLNLEQILSGAPLDTAIGVLQIIVRSARDIKGPKIGGGAPDPYVSITLNNRAELARTKYKTNASNPTWMETKFLVVNSLRENLVFSVMDYNDHRQNSLLGSVSFALEALEQDATQEDIVSPILKEGKERGELRFDVNFYPVISISKTSEGTVQKLPDTNVGIVRLVLHQAKDLDNTKGDLNPFAKVYLGNQPSPTYTSKILKHTNDPVWESSTEFLCTDKKTSIITVKVIDDRDFLKDPVVGYMSVRLTDLLRANDEAGKDWWPLNGCKSGRIRLSTEWKPLEMSLHGVDQYVPPIGVVRLLLKRAADVKNVEAALGGKSDPYVRVLVNNVVAGRTEVINNDLNPVWDQIIYIPVHSLKETLFLECMDYQHITRDRSLGYTELRLCDLAAEADSEEYPYKSTGKKVEAGNLKLDTVFKGQLHYEAEFVPALALKNFRFSAGGNDIQHAVDGTGSEGGSMDNGDGGSVSSSDVEAEAVPAGITTRGPLGATKKEVQAQENGSTDTAVTTDAESNVNPTEPSGEKGAKGKSKAGVVLSKEELMHHQSGIIVFNITTAQLSKKARLEVLLDDAYWPAFTTSVARSRHVTWDYTGEGFIKELDFGRVWLRLNEADEGTKDDIIAEWKEDAKKFLQDAMDHTVTRTLYDSDGKSIGTVDLEARFIPVPIKLEPRESINNQGILQVQLLNGGDIRGADRSGKSDPYVVFTLDGQKVYKSQPKKKTLTPEWGETFAVSIPSRVGADFKLEVFDWNQLEQHKSLGTARIGLEDVEPFRGQEKTLPLSHANQGEKGWVRVHMNFQPEIIVKSRAKTSTFSTAGRAMTQVSAMPLQAGKGVIHGVTRVFGRGGNNSSDDGVIVDPPEMGSGQASRPIGANGIGVGGDVFTGPGQQISTVGGHATERLAEPGILRVTVIEAKDYNPGADGLKPYVILKCGDKEHKTSHHHRSTSAECSWNEQCSFVVSSDQSKILVWVHDYKTIGRDKLLGAGEIDVWRHLTPAKGINSSEVHIQLNEGQGLLKVRLDYSQEDYHHLPRGSSFQSLADATNPKAMSSPSRFSLRGKRPGPGSDDS